MSRADAKWIEVRISQLSEEQRAKVAATTAALLRARVPVAKVRVEVPKPPPQKP